MAQNDTSAPRARRPARTRSIAEPFSQQLHNVEQSSGELLKRLREQIDRRPYATLGAGLATGFVLGGGLTLRLTGALVGVAGRVAMANMISAALRGMQPTDPNTPERSDA
jgi:hypothetical protein